jgi:hypothetical protein
VIVVIMKGPSESFRDDALPVLSLMTINPSPLDVSLFPPPSKLKSTKTHLSPQSHPFGHSHAIRSPATPKFLNNYVRLPLSSIEVNSCCDRSLVWPVASSSGCRMEIKQQHARRTFDFSVFSQCSPPTLFFRIYLDLIRLGEKAIC